MKRQLLLIFLVIFVVAACAVNPASATTIPLPESTKTVPSAPTVTLENRVNTATPEKKEPEIIFHADIPIWVKDTIQKDAGFALSISNIENEVTIGFENTGYPVAVIQYFLVTAFNTPFTSISLSDFQSIWSHGENESSFSANKILLDAETAHILAVQWGEPDNEALIIEATVEGVVEKLLTENEYQLAIIPAQALTPQIRTIRMDNQSFFQTGESLSRSTFQVQLFSPFPLVDEPIQINFSMDTITSVNITGVTALTRATAVLMRKYGNSYPAVLIQDILTDADYTHISNEVVFTPACPPQQYTSEELRFCSPPSTFELLKFIEADIVELTGDHLVDYGIKALNDTLAAYEDAGIVTYGGGKNLDAARSPLRIEHHGNKIAFIGCNAKSPAYARAAEALPGTWFCDIELLKTIIIQLHQEGYLPIVTIQHLENNIYQPPPQLVEDFDELGKLTPIILIGSQAHVPKPYVVQDGLFIHYGLGNLFFDQINESEAHGQALIDRLIFSNNQLLSVDIYPLRFLDYAQSRPMTAEEEMDFLSIVFSFSQFPLP